MDSQNCGDTHGSRLKTLLDDSCLQLM